MAVPLKYRKEYTVGDIKAFGRILTNKVMIIVFHSKDEDKAEEKF